MGNVNASAVKVDALRPGDHIFIWDRTLWPFTYQHHGIVWKSGESVEDVQICHVWTPLEGFRQAQADSSFRVSTLEQFLYHRSLNDLRLVELLLGRGRGDYHPIIQNCEHAARWCKTGSQWSTQTLTPGHGTIPFEDQLRTADVLAMKHQVAVIERDTARKPVVDGVQQGLRVELQCRTLFWLDSFSAEMINVRQSLARQVFKLPPVSNVCHFRFKNTKWNTDILWGNSSRAICKKPHRGVSWFRQVEFATSFLKTPVRPVLFSVVGLNLRPIARLSCTTTPSSPQAACSIVETSEVSDTVDTSHCTRDFCRDEFAKKSASTSQIMGGVYTRVQNISSLRPGDHICIWDYSRWPLSYQHHGIVWASADQPQDIRVCHVWSPLQGYREAQADSCFRISTLEEFLYNRSLDDLRLVEYHTSAFRDFLSKWGEVHRAKSDLPEVVLARCKFLLGLGKGDFNIFTQNCEHAAHWCKTGQQWSKQILTKVNGRVPFENRLAKEDVDALEKEIDEIKAVSRTVVSNVLRLSGSKVYLRVHGNKYVRIMDDGLHVDVVPEGESPEACGRTAFRLECYSKEYNCVKVAFFHEESGRYMFSRSTFSCFRDLRMKKANCLRGTSGMRWEYSSGGHLNSMNQHRRYIGTRDDGLLVDVSLRGDASYFEFVPVKTIVDGQVGAYVPPDITLIRRSYNHAKSVEETRSQSMLELEEERRGLQEPTPL